MRSFAFFSDSLSIVFKDEDAGESVAIPLLKTGIAWSTDKNVKFKNPEGTSKHFFFRLALN
jgi:hypothetical protein